MGVWLAVHPWFFKVAIYEALYLAGPWADRLKRKPPKKPKKPK
jgi:hypothetical protein